MTGHAGEHGDVKVKKSRAWIDALRAHAVAVRALVHIEGLPYKEAAQIIGTPMGTLTSRLARGRDTLQELLDPGDAA